MDKWHTVTELHGGRWLAYHGSHDHPYLVWVENGEIVGWRRSLRVRLKLYPDHLEYPLWRKALDTWLHNPQNDCLRARGDIQWRVAVRAEAMLASTLDSQGILRISLLG